LIHYFTEEANDVDGDMETESETLQGQDEEHLEDIAQQEAAAQSHWDQHIACNKSVIIDTFQGQFRSTVSSHSLRRERERNFIAIVQLRDLPFRCFRGKTLYRSFAAMLNPIW
jgi:ubiquitin C-terminal hydrolase